MKRIIAVCIAAALVVGGYAYSCVNRSELSSTATEKFESVPDTLSSRVEGITPGGYIDASVVKTVDGDTIDISYKGRVYRVRLLDIDTPESVKNGVPVQPYGREAANYTRKLTRNKSARLVFEKGLRDKYGRLLAHVILNDGQYLNAMLVRNGYARVEIIKPNESMTQYFYGLQEKAISEKTGLWSLPENRRPFVRSQGEEYIPAYWLEQRAS
jgi:micrococcal nuclease